MFKQRCFICEKSDVEIDSEMSMCSECIERLCIKCNKCGEYYQRKEPFCRNCHSIVATESGYKILKQGKFYIKRLTDNTYWSDIRYNQNHAWYKNKSLAVIFNSKFEALYSLIKAYNTDLDRVAKCIAEIEVKELEEDTRNKWIVYYKIHAVKTYTYYLTRHKDTKSFVYFTELPFGKDRELLSFSSKREAYTLLGTEESLNDTIENVELTIKEVSNDWQPCQYE